MSTTSPIYGLPLPASTDTDQVAAAFMSYVTAAEKLFVGPFANAGARDAKITSPQGGMIVWLTSPGKYVYYDPTASAWLDLFNPQAWGTFTPTLQTPGASAVNLGTGATQIGRFQQYGKTVTFQCSWVFGSTLGSVPSGPLYFALPVAPTLIAGLAQNGVCSLWVPSIGKNFSGVWVVNDSTGLAKVLYPTSPTASTTDYFQSKDGTGAVGTGVPLISGQFTIQPNGSMSASGSYQIA